MDDPIISTLFKSIFISPEYQLLLLQELEIVGVILLPDFPDIEEYFEESQWENDPGSLPSSIGSPLASEQDLDTLDFNSDEEF